VGKFASWLHARTVKQRLFQFGTAPALKEAPARWGVPGIEKGIFKMFSIFSSARENATIFAGAFISALLLVSAATSLPIA
jgi:hypothetical protein